jgi:hypothetical protein
MRALRGRHEIRHAHTWSNEGTRRMTTVSAAGNRNLHSVSVLPDERTESEDRH